MFGRILWQGLLSHGFYVVGFGVLFSACLPRTQSESSQANNDANRTVTDMRGVSVRLPKQPQRVISVSDGLIESVMAHLGVIDRLVALGSSCVQRDFTYDIPGKAGTFTYSGGMNPIRLLYPKTADLPLVAKSGTPLQLEQILALAPDLVILREGCCTLTSLDDPKNKQALSTLEASGIPVFVLKGTSMFDPPDLDKLDQEIRLLGQIFSYEEKAEQLILYLNTSIRFIQNRTSSLHPAVKPRLLLLGLSPTAREGGSAGVTKGKDTIEGYFIEQLVRATNAYQGPGGRSTSLMLSDEQILALDPDVIVLPTASGYHPPEEIYEAPYYTKLQRLRAVQNKKVVALPWTPCNCSKRLEYPIEVIMIAKSAYPDAFAEISIHEWVLDFYQKIYGVSREKAKEIRSAQWLDWTIDTF